jgi:PAS domain-containing protein
MRRRMLHYDPAETTAQMRIRQDFDHWILTFTTTQDSTRRRAAARRIRELARDCAWLADQMPDAVWEAIYCVRAARGTVAP